MGLPATVSCWLLPESNRVRGVPPLVHNPDCWCDRHISMRMHKRELGGGKSVHLRSTVSLHGYAAGMPGAGRMPLLHSTDLSVPHHQLLHLFCPGFNSGRMSLPTGPVYCTDLPQSLLVLPFRPVQPRGAILQPVSALRSACMGWLLLSMCCWHL